MACPRGSPPPRVFGPGGRFLIRAEPGRDWRGEVYLAIDTLDDRRPEQVTPSALKRLAPLPFTRASWRHKADILRLLRHQHIVRFLERADFFALAKTLYVLLTSRPPEPFAIGALPLDFRPALARAADRDPDRRFATALDMLVEWARAVDAGESRRSGGGASA